MVASGKVIFDDYQSVKEAYELVEEMTSDYNLESLNEAAENIEDLVSDDPSTSVYQTIPVAVRNLVEARRQVEPSDRSDLSNVVDLLETEKKGHPAQTERRHYDSFRDQQNL